MADELVTSFSNLKTFGNKFLKGLAVEAYLTFNKDELISRLKVALSLIKPKDIPDFVKGKQALPIPTTFFEAMKGFEDYLETVKEQRIFEWIAEANPAIAKALIDLGDEGALYVVHFKAYIIDSIKAVAGVKETAIEEPPEAEGEGETETIAQEIPQAEEGEQQQTREKGTCDSCGETFVLPKEELEALKECPVCGEPT